jgi:hypothetical protein
LRGKGNRRPGVALSELQKLIDAITITNDQAKRDGSTIGNTLCISEEWAKELGLISGATLCDGVKIKVDMNIEYGTCSLMYYSHPAITARS